MLCMFCEKREQEAFKNYCMVLLHAIVMELDHADLN